MVLTSSETFPRNSFIKNNTHQQYIKTQKLIGQSKNEKKAPSFECTIKLNLATIMNWRLTRSSASMKIMLGGVYAVVGTWVIHRPANSSKVGDPARPNMTATPEENMELTRYSVCKIN